MINEPENLFHRIALEEYALAWLQGRAQDSDYVKQKAYDRYENELCRISKEKATLE
jgi:hypothetical protein